MREANWNPGVSMAVVLAVALAVRIAAVVHWHERLSEDRDGYLAIAAGIVEGRGVVDPSTGEPTAYRPPLYPVLVAGIELIGGGPTMLGIAQVLLGTLTVVGTFAVGRRLGMIQAAVGGAALVAVDPLLVQYTAYAMTETLFTALISAFLAVAVDASGTWCGGSRRRSAVAGALFGLCALCRPTMWAFGGLLALSGVVPAAAAWLGCRRGARAGDATGSINLAAAVVTAGVAALVVLPWTVRNGVVFDKPIVTTTHGGYTLLLANNPVVYREEVEKPWGTTWDDAPPGRRQSDWLESVRIAMRNDLGDAASEPERNAWMTRRARSHIRDEPRTFARACWLRVRRLWNVAPLGPAAGGMPRPIVWGVGAYYAVVFALAVVGLTRLTRAERRAWRPLLLLIVSVTLVHAVYWSNARMRAPLMPAVALLAARFRARPGDAESGEESEG